jgi:hypothetical protein
VGVLRKRKFLWGAACAAIGAFASTPMALVILNATSAAPGRLPAGWQLKVNRGTPDITLIGEPGGQALRFKSRKSSFARERGVDVDIAQFPVLSWTWKVSELPAGGDFRSSSTDDQAAQVLVAFSDRRILSYIWDSSAPKGVREPASALPFLRISALVCRSGRQELNRWLPESHNLAEDYQNAFDRPLARVKAIRLQINTQHTGSSAESYFGDISFRAARQ